MTPPLSQNSVVTSAMSPQKNLHYPRYRPPRSSRILGAFGVLGRVADRSNKTAGASAPMAECPVFSRRNPSPPGDWKLKLPARAIMPVASYVLFLSPDHRRRHDLPRALLRAARMASRRTLEPRRASRQWPTRHPPPRSHSPPCGFGGRRPYLDSRRLRRRSPCGQAACRQPAKALSGPPDFRLDHHRNGPTPRPRAPAFRRRHLLFPARLDRARSPRARCHSPFARDRDGNRNLAEFPARSPPHESPSRFCQRAYLRKIFRPFQTLGISGRPVFQAHFAGRGAFSRADARKTGRPEIP